MIFNNKRVRKLNSEELKPGHILYCITREHRVEDNWSFIFAQALAEKNNSSLVVCFSLMNNYLGATRRQYDFMIRGLEEVEKKLNELEIPFYLLYGDPTKSTPEFLNRFNFGAIVTDFSPLNINKDWDNYISKQIKLPFYKVDAHNIIPAWEVSDKQEYAAYTIRPKIYRKIKEFCIEIPKPRVQKFKWSHSVPKNDWISILNSAKFNNSVNIAPFFKPGFNQAKLTFEDFLETGGLKKYAKVRNDPNLEGQSNLSPYLRFGHISSQRIVLEILKKYPKYPPEKENMNPSSNKLKDESNIDPQVSVNAFLEELVVRRELSENFCFYNPNYDSFEGFSDWAKETLKDHWNDKREYIYTLSELEESKTHDDLWNAAQSEMVLAGKMHGYLRMYWAKKILEWTENPKQAFEYGIYLNDKYELDGRDPNGYTGVAWSVGGVHDRPWFDRPVFGKIRYMAYSGCKKKFDVKKYIEKIHNILNSSRKK